MRKLLKWSLLAVLAFAFCATYERAPALASSPPSPCGENLLINGSFEDGPDPGEWTTLHAGSTALQGWTVTHGSVDIVGSLWAASDGKRSIDLDGVSFGGISQAFETVAGKTYVVSFAFAGNRYGQPAVKSMQVSAADQNTKLQYDLRTETGWQPESWSFVAKAASTTLGFDSLDTVNGYFGPVIDNVRVQTACE